MTTDEKYMARCIQLARCGIYGAAPNPLVGAVVVHNDRIIGEGFHARCGEGHAEVNAIASVKNKNLLEQATIYVSLEPCAHYGKTPPCAELIARMRIPRVVVGCVDPFGKVSGRGIAMLREAGCEVVVGVLEKECQELNRKFFTQQTAGRPYVTLKWAESVDGFVDLKRTGGQAVKLSSALTQMVAHKRRAEHMGILVGTRTALLDNPSLNVRQWCGPQPTRLVIDREGKLPQNLTLFDGSQPTLVLTEKPGNDQQNVTFVVLDFSKPLVPQIMQTCLEHKLQSLLVEGGSHTLQAFINEQTYDEIWVEHCPQRLGSGVPAPRINGTNSRQTTCQIMGRKYHIIPNFP